MNEIEKMYENASVALPKVCTYEDYNCDELQCNRCEYFKSNIFEFTSKKQIEILKLLCQRRFIELGTTPDNEYFLYDHNCCQSHSQHFNEAVAKFVSMLWQDLTDEEKQQIKEILNEKL